jgi:hypothetical protein
LELLKLDLNVFCSFDWLRHFRQHAQYYGRTVDLPEEVDCGLIQRTLLSEKRFFGLTPDDLSPLAFQIAEADNVPLCCRARETNGRGPAVLADSFHDILKYTFANEN